LNKFNETTDLSISEARELSAGVASPIQPVENVVHDISSDCSLDKRNHIELPVEVRLTIIVYYTKKNMKTSIYF